MMVIYQRQIFIVLRETLKKLSIQGVEEICIQVKFMFYELNGKEVILLFPKETVYTSLQRRFRIISEECLRSTSPNKIVLQVAFNCNKMLNMHPRPFVSPSL